MFPGDLPRQFERDPGTAKGAVSIGRTRRLKCWMNQRERFGQIGRVELKVPAEEEARARELLDRGAIEPPFPENE